MWSTCFLLCVAQNNLKGKDDGNNDDDDDDDHKPKFANKFCVILMRNVNKSKLNRIQSNQIKSNRFHRFFESHLFPSVLPLMNQKQSHSVQFLQFFLFNCLTLQKWRKIPVSIDYH